MGRLSSRTIKSHRAALAAVGLIVVIGALLRLHNLDAESIWWDEAASWVQSKDSLFDLIWRTAHDNYPPLHNLFLFVDIKLLGESEWSLRLPSVIFGVVNIVALYWLGTMTVGRSSGLIAAVLLTLSPFHLWYSQEARMYSLVALAATLYAATCFYYLRSPSLWRGAWVSLAGLALVYSHVYGALDWLAIAVAFAVLVLPVTSMPQRSLRVWIAANAVIAVGFAPWALILAHRTRLVVGTDGPPAPLSSAAFIFDHFQDFAGGRLFTAMIIIGVVLGILGRLRRDVVLLWTWIVVPIVLGVLTTPGILLRYMIGSLPPLLLLSAFGWTRYAKTWQVPILTVVTIAMAGVDLQHYHYSEHHKDDWRDVASFLKERASPTDCVLIVPHWEAAVLDYYWRDSICQWRPMKLADLPAEMPSSALFGVFHLQVQDITPYIGELRRRGWHDVNRNDFHGIQVVTFSR
jgi:mannosyltransferase